jgi:choline kinase
MQIDHCLILAAGFGTRMGKIGESLPKVMWPVFEKPLLELQVRYARSLGVKNIFINLHHQASLIEEACRKLSAFEGVEFIREEPEILDIGGGVHNVSRLVGKKGRLLVLNADQFFYLKPDEFHSLIKGREKEPCLLFTNEVNSSDGYNALQLKEDGSLSGITKNTELPRGTAIETYTGNALINLKEISPVIGPSKFFESVANWNSVSVSRIKLDVDYWDFGTRARFWETSFRILERYRVNSNHPFLRFLVQERALKTWKIDLNQLSYNAVGEKVINLNPDKYTGSVCPAMILSGTSDKIDPETISWNGVVDSIRS